MIPRLRSLLIVFAFFASVFFIHPASTQIQTTSYAYCYSDLGSSPVYFTNVFDLGVIVQDSNPLQHEFSEYLRGRYDVKNFPAGCPISFTTRQEAEAGKQNFENQLRQTNKEIIEIDWLHAIDRSLAAPPGQHRITTVVSQLPIDHTFCFSETYAGAIYVTGPELSGTSVNLSNWTIGFTQYLKQRYSFTGKVNCEVATRPTALRLVSAHEQGAAAANKRIVDTGWRFDPNAVATAPQQDEDREPTPNRPVAPQASQTELQQARAAATTERPASAAYCRNDPILSVVFSCADFSQAVFAYRVAHRADSGAKEPFSRLLDDENFQCTGCVNGVQVMTYVERRARAEKVDPKAMRCITSTLTKTLNQNIHHTRELDRFYKESVAQCNQ